MDHSKGFFSAELLVWVHNEAQDEAEQHDDEIGMKGVFGSRWYEDCQLETNED